VDRRLHLVLDSDRFRANKPIAIKEDLSEIRFELETNNPARHVSRLRIAGLPPGTYAVKAGSRTIKQLELKDSNETVIEIPVSQERAGSFTVSFRRVK
jgi:hypothetical protein